MRAVQQVATVVVLLALWPCLAGADTESARARGGAWLLKQQRGDGAWSGADDALEVQATAAALQALRKAGLARSPAHGAGMAWLGNAPADSVDALARKVQGLSAAGLAAQAQREADRLYALRSLDALATWGGYGGSGVDLVDTALGLGAMRLGDAGYASTKVNAAASAICQLLDARMVSTDGRSAWAAAPSTSGQAPGFSQPSVMATALLAAEIRAMDLRLNLTSLTCSGAAVSLGAVAAQAAAWLVDQQNAADGGWGEARSDGSKGPSSVLLTALTYQALTAQAVVPSQAAAALNWLLAQQDAGNGSWRGDPLVTASVLAALPAATGVQALDTDRDGVTDVVEVQAGSNPGVADPRAHLAPPTLAAPGVTWSAFVAEANLGQNFSRNLGPGSGFAITAGSLPPGVTLEAGTGQLSGVATQAGSYSFDYRFLADGRQQQVIGRIDVVDPEAAALLGEAPLPLWALLALGGSLAAAGRRWRPGTASALHPSQTEQRR